MYFKECDTNKNILWLTVVLKEEKGKVYSLNYNTKTLIAFNICDRLNAALDIAKGKVIGKLLKNHGFSNQEIDPNALTEREMHEIYGSSMDHSGNDWSESAYDQEHDYRKQSHFM